MKLSRRRLAVAALALVFIAAGIILTLSDMRPVDGLGLWHTSQMYDTNMNQSYSIVFYSVNFTFTHTEFVPTDAPTPVHFMITFPDGTIELLNTTIGGMLARPPRVVFSTHPNPYAAIISSIDSDHWYEWYYAVSL